MLTSTTTYRLPLIAILIGLLVCCFLPASVSAAMQVIGNDTAVTYTLDSNPPFHFVSLLDDPLATQISFPLLQDDTDLALNLTTDAAEFVFPFFGVQVPGNRIVLGSNGYISFDGFTINQPWEPVCPLPVSNSSAFDRGFAFAWTDNDFTLGGFAFYRFFPAGSCPYPYSAEACLVVHFDHVKLYNSNFSGDANAILFAPSGILLSQVKTLT